MNVPAPKADELTSLVERADRASVAGNLEQASALLEIATQHDCADVETWLKFAAIRRGLKDERGALDAVEGALRIDPLNFIALLLHATVLEKLDHPESDEYFGRALAQRPSGLLAPQMQKMLDHAAVRYAAWQKIVDGNLREALDRLNLPPTHESDRLGRFRTNIVRLTRPYHSEPSDYHYPGLPEVEFYDRDMFEWVDRLEAATNDIAIEFNQCVSAERNELVPYVQYADGQPVRQWATLNHSFDWSAIHLLRNGTPVAVNVQHCPKTMALLASLPQPQIAGVSPNAMFSLLAPGAKIPPHTGVSNTRLICHLPLIIPDGCWFRVGAQRRSWQYSVAWVFDDTIEHEAENESNELRVVLIFDVWQPALSAVERDGVSAILTANEANCRVT